MGVTLLAVLTAALLLPGIIAAKFFYRAGSTPEVDAVLPSLSSAEGLAQLGLFSVAVHLLYATALLGISALPDWTGLPLADPYLPLIGGDLPPTRGAVWSLFAGIALLCAAAVPCGMVAGALVYRFGDRSLFYGPLTELIAQGRGRRRFITAYILSKVGEDGRHLGYQGTVKSLVRDADRLPAKIVLQDAYIFTLTVTSHGTTRRENERQMEWITLSATDWHNVAFRVFELVD
jgi:hypothetical protein